MKKYIAGGMVAFITATLIGMMAGQSQASVDQQSVESVICHQQDQGVIVCPLCRGSGKIAGQKCIRCQGRGIVKSDGRPPSPILTVVPF